MSQLITNTLTTIDTPIVLADDTTSRGGVIQLSERYRHTYSEAEQGYGAVRLGNRSSIEQTQIRGPGRGWWEANNLWPLRGVSAVGVADVSIKYVSVYQVMAEAFYLRDVRNTHLMREPQFVGLKAERCNVGLMIDWPRLSGNYDLWLDGLLCVDTWSPQAINAIGPSLLYPGQFVGGNALVATGVVRGKFHDVVSAGEGKGAKLTQCFVLDMRGFRVPQLWLGGDSPLIAGWRGPQHAGRYSLGGDSVIGESTWGFSANQTSDPAALYCQGPLVYDALKVDHTTILAPRPGPLSNSGVVGYPDWRFECVVAGNGFKVELGDGVRLLDLDGDGPEPVWLNADAASGAQVTEVVPAKRERVKPRWMQ